MANIGKVPSKQISRGVIENFVFLRTSMSCSIFLLGGVIPIWHTLIQHELYIFIIYDPTGRERNNFYWSQVQVLRFAAGSKSWSVANGGKEILFNVYVCSFYREIMTTIGLLATTNLMAAVKCANLKTKTQIAIIEIEIIEKQNLSGKNISLFR